MTGYEHEKIKIMTKWRRRLAALLAVSILLSGGAVEAATATASTKTIGIVKPAPITPQGSVNINTGKPGVSPHPYRLLLARKLDDSLWHDLESSEANAWLVNDEIYLPLSALAKLYPVKLRPIAEKGKPLLELQWNQKTEKLASSAASTIAAAKPPLLTGLGMSGESWISATVWSRLTGMEVITAQMETVILNSTGTVLKNNPELDAEWQMTERPRVYGYRELSGDMAALKKRYPDMNLEALGKSSTGSVIPLVKIGSGPREVFISGAWHGEEWITAQLLANFTERMLQRRQAPEYQNLLQKLTLYIAPMINPDGCEIAAHWDDLPAKTLQPAVNALLPAGYQPREWRANAQGYDLNNQFPIHWDRTYELTKNRGPAFGVSGPAPLVAIESRQVYDFTLKRHFVAVFCYHSQGSVIYWEDEDRSTAEMKRIADLYARQSGYWRVDNEPLQGGYRDWFVAKYHRPGLTVEVGQGENPLPVQDFYDINERNQRALLESLAALADE
ncbi:MAG TPA: M14 family zinc carboxypeptidase [Patescibacteria group bacterium]|nr:M14 family zinc carboxypeptidase [Patescibacteria group bacterium]